MAQGRKGKLNFRCPRCLMREIDMDMLFDSDKGEYYCPRCSFVGPRRKCSASTRSSARNTWTGRCGSRTSSALAIVGSAWPLSDGPGSVSLRPRGVA